MTDWIITQDMMDRATAIFTQTTGNPLANAVPVPEKAPALVGQRPVDYLPPQSNAC